MHLLAGNSSLPRSLVNRETCPSRSDTQAGGTFSFLFYRFLACVFNDTLHSNKTKHPRSQGNAADAPLARVMMQTRHTTTELTITDKCRSSVGSLRDVHERVLSRGNSLFTAQLCLTSGMPSVTICSHFCVLQNVVANLIAKLHLLSRDISATILASKPCLCPNDHVVLTLQHCHLSSMQVLRRSLRQVLLTFHYKT